MTAPANCDAEMLEAAESPRATSRLAHVDGLRALAALWVMVFHVGVFLSLNRSLAGTPLGPIVRAGGLGVPMFIVISGYCLALSPQRDNVERIHRASFMRRRAIRILPTYVVVTMALALLYSVAFFRAHAQQPPTFVDLVLHLSMIHNLVPGHALRISGPLWSVAVECQLYLLFPALFLGLRRPRITLAVTALVAGTFIATVAATHLDRHVADSVIVIWQSAPAFLPAFLGGMLIARRSVLGHTLPARLTFGPAAVSFLLAVILATESHVSPVVPVYLTALGTVLLLSTTPDAFTTSLARRPLAWLGLVSYSLYLTHAPIVSLAGKLVAHRSSSERAATAAVAMCAAVMVAFCCYELVEKRAGRALTKRFGRPAQRVPTADPGATSLAASR